MTLHHWTYPEYLRGERIADGVMHLLGIVFALVGTALLVTFAALYVTGGRVAAVSVYGAVLCLSLGASALYHFTPWERARPFLRRVDHAAIYLKIAGTYTPLVVLMNSVFAYVVLASVWVVALMAAGAKIFFWRQTARPGVMVYLALGWASVLLVWSLFPVLPYGASALIVVGGLLYSAGIIFFNKEDMRFSMAIWHGFVLAASVCFYAAITLSVFLTA